jgi:hypothetical protein
VQGIVGHAADVCKRRISLSMRLQELIRAVSWSRSLVKLDNRLSADFLYVPVQRSYRLEMDASAW